MFLSRSALAQTPAAPESGPCSLAKAEPAIVASVSPDFDIILADGCRAGFAGLEFPRVPGETRDAALTRLIAWLDGAQVFVEPLAAAPDRWGTLPVQVIAASSEKPAAPLVSVGVALIGEGLARYRPDRPAAPCAKAYLQAEALPRARKTGVWAEDPEIDASMASLATLEALLRKEGDDRARRQGRLNRRDDGSHLPEFREKSRPRRCRRDFQEEYAYIPGPGMDSPFAARTTHSRTRLDRDQ